MTADAPRGFWNPYVQLGIGALLVTASELLLKLGATRGVHAPPQFAWLGVGALASWWTWAGITTYIASFASWLYVLRHMALSIAFSLINIVHVLVPLGAWFFLGEAISLQRWAGITLVLCGTVLVSRSEPQT